MTPFPPRLGQIAVNDFRAALECDFPVRDVRVGQGLRWLLADGFGPKCDTDDGSRRARQK